MKISISTLLHLKRVVVNYFTSQSCDLFFSCKIIYNTSLQNLKLKQVGVALMQQVFLQTNNYLNSLKLTSSKKYFLQSLIYLTKGNFTQISDEKLINNTKLHKSVVYRQLEYFKNNGHIEIKKFHGKRHILANIPAYLKEFLNNQDSLKQQDYLVFSGVPVESAKTEYNGKVIEKVRLKNVYDHDKYLHFPDYWVPKEAIIAEVEAKDGRMCFKACLYLNKSKHFLLKIFQNQSLGVVHA